MKDYVQCNVCGKEIERINNIFKEDFLAVTKEWGYFSEKDLERHSFRICEECYNQWIQTFAVPVTKENTTEAV